MTSICIASKWLTIKRGVLFILFLILALPIISSAAIPADPNGSFRFIVWADSRGQSSGVNTAVLADLSNIASTLDPAFTIFPGDLCYSFNVSCIQDTWKPAINGNSNNGMLNKTFVSRGNHDNGTLSSWQSLWNFSTVANSIGATNYFAETSEATYSFDYGNSHFAVIDLPGGGVNTITPAQIDWLNSDLTAAENRLGIHLKHEFIFWHGPVYSVTAQHGSQKPSSTLITVLNAHPLISAGFFGHEHVTVNAHIDSRRVSGITNGFEEFILGRAGAPAYSVLKPVDFSDNSDAFAAVDVSGNDSTVSIYRSNVAYARTFTESGITPTPPQSISDLVLQASGITWLKFTWFNPPDSDFSHVMLYLNGSFKTSINAPQNYYLLKGLQPDTIYELGTHTVDTSGNVNETWVNAFARTLPESIAPRSITNLTIRTYTTSYINWTWKDPKDADFAKVMVYINGKFKKNVTKGKKYYNATNLTPNTRYTISTHTVDISGNINKTWVNNTAKTATVNEGNAYGHLYEQMDTHKTGDIPISR